MLKIGLTGGIGSGKSIVSEVFLRLGVPVYQADIRAKELISSNASVKDEIIRYFGSEAFKGHEYNTKYIAGIVFKNPEKLKRINQIVHPEVLEDFTEWTKVLSQRKYVIHEAAILFESKLNDHLDYIIFVDAPESLRIERIIKRDKSSEKEIRKRIRNQWPADKIKSLADWIITNDDKTLILPQIIKIHKHIERLHG